MGLQCEGPPAEQSNTMSLPEEQGVVNLSKDICSTWVCSSGGGEEVEEKCQIVQKAFSAPPTFAWRNQLALASELERKEQQQLETDEDGEELIFLRPIGQGAFGKVDLGRRASHPDERCAIKTVKSNNASTIMELAALEKMSHPFIAHLRFVFEDQLSETLCMGIDYYEGGDLFQLMEETPLSVTEARFFAMEIALALRHVHLHNCIYGDLKPENIAIGADGHIRLIDFGLCADLNLVGVETAGRLQVVTNSGTLHYSSPLMLKRRPHGIETDWWSFSVLLFEMVFDELPWGISEASLSTEEVCARICDSSFQMYAPASPFPCNEDDATMRQKVFSFCNFVLDKTCTLQPDFDLISQAPLFADVDWAAAEDMKYPAPFVLASSELS